MVTAEVLDGQINCGFGYIKKKVDRAEIEGSILPERVETDKFGQDTYFYASPVGFDPRKSTVAITVGGRRYRSDPASVKQFEEKATFPLMAE